MKRTPLAIINDLLLTLNCLITGREYSINTLASISNIHWETTDRYLEIINKILTFAPLFIYTPEGKIKIVQKNQQLNIENDDLILLFALQNKAFDKKSALKLPDDFEKEIDFLENKKFGQRTIDNKFFLNERGRDMALDVLLEIQEKIEKQHLNPSFMFNPSYYDDQLETEDLGKLDQLADKIILLVKEKLEQLISVVNSNDDVIAIEYGF